MGEGNVSLEKTDDDSLPRIYSLKRGKLEVKVTEWGATIMSVMVPDAKGQGPFPNSYQILLSLSLGWILPHEIGIELQFCSVFLSSFSSVTGFRWPCPIVSFLVWTHEP